VRPQIHRDKRFGHQVGALTFQPRVFMRTKICIRPAIESALFHTGEIIRHQVVAQAILSFTAVHKVFVPGCQSMPTGLRIPEAKTRSPDPSGLISRISALLASWSIHALHCCCPIPPTRRSSIHLHWQ